MTTAVLSCVACLMLGWAWGWRTRDRTITKRADDLRELTMMLRGHVEAAEFETIARKVGAA